MSFRRERVGLDNAAIAASWNHQEPLLQSPDEIVQEKQIREVLLDGETPHSQREALSQS